MVFEEEDKNNKIPEAAALCLNISDENIKKKYDHCSRVVYIPKTKSYQCI
jgi:hypothetical protein